MFEVSQFDNFSYLFNQPRLVNLEGKPLPASLTIEGMALGLNGKEVTTGQSWLKQQFVVPAATELKEPVMLSSQGTIIAAENGSNNDEFFLSFGRIGEFTNVRVEQSYPEQQIHAETSQSADVGLRTFAKVHASMSQLTGVPQQQTKVAGVYQTIIRQLPSDASIETFISAQQMAVTQLGIAYCDAAIEDATIRNQWFGAFSFTGAPAIVYAPGQRETFIDTLLDRLQPRSPQNSAPRADTEAEVSALIDRLSACGAACSSDRSKTIAKAACTSVLASADLLVQ
jgi:hypothetical protein